MQNYILWGFMSGLLGAWTIFGLLLGAFVWPVYKEHKLTSDEEEDPGQCGQKCPLEKYYRVLAPLFKYYSQLVGMIIGTALAVVLMIIIMGIIAMISMIIR